ncbi:MAG: hypothetical protein LBR22_03315 [Desulfovibrio sp.]|jgi:hypothetical protein|nr:hypothetical protein [Desulfovibrio sp.]
MNRYGGELFGRFSYDDELTYEEMTASESALIAELSGLLPLAGAGHVDFSPTGEYLWFQCVFDRPKAYVFRKLAMEMAARAPEGVSGRLLCLDKGLDTFLVYYVERGSWQEEKVTLPVEPSGRGGIHRIVPCRDAGGHAPEPFGECG